MRCRLCDRALTSEESYEVCDDCGIRIARRYREQLLAEVRAEDEEHRKRTLEAKADRRQREEAARPPDPIQPEQTGTVVYYVRTGDYIKIGYSAHLRHRLVALRVADNADLLAVEPGGQVREAERHAEFRHLRVDPKWENFEPADDLMAHIARLHAEHGIPEWVKRKPRSSRHATPVVVRFAGD